MMINANKVLYDEKTCRKIYMFLFISLISLLQSNYTYAVFIGPDGPEAEGEFVEFSFTLDDDAFGPATDVHFLPIFDGFNYGPLFGSANIGSYDWSYLVGADTAYTDDGSQFGISGVSQGLLPGSETGEVFDSLAYCIYFTEGLMPGQTLNLIVDAKFLNDGLDPEYAPEELFDPLFDPANFSFGDGSFAPVTLGNSGGFDPNGRFVPGDLEWRFGEPIEPGYITTTQGDDFVLHHYDTEVPEPYALTLLLIGGVLTFTSKRRLSKSEHYEMFVVSTG